MSSVAVAHELPHGVHPEPTSFWRKYIFSLDHKVIGKQYLLYALFMLVIGGLLATLVRSRGRAGRSPSWPRSRRKECPAGRCCPSSTTRSSRCTRRS